MYPKSGFRLVSGRGIQEPTQNFDGVTGGVLSSHPNTKHLKIKNKIKNIW